MNFLLFATTAALLISSSASALTLLGFCPRPGMIRFSHRHRFHWNFLPRFRRFARIKRGEHQNVFENGVHDAENVFHIIKSLPSDCFTYVSDQANASEYNT